MPQPDLHAHLAEIRRLTRAYQEGRSPASFTAFRDLVQLLFSTTIIPEHVAVRLAKGSRPDVYVLGGYRGPTDALVLNNGHFLRLTMTLVLTDTADGPRMKVDSSSVQYQLDAQGDHAVFRYDYLREPPDVYPSAHLHVRGALTEPCLSAKQTLEDLHFPTNRVSLESIIRLLIEQFNIQSQTDAALWRPLLAESEAAFHTIAHRPQSGPRK